MKRQLWKLFDGGIAASTAWILVLIMGQVTTVKIELVVGFDNWLNNPREEFMTLSTKMVK